MDGQAKVRAAKPCVAAGQLRPICCETKAPMGCVRVSVSRQTYDAFLKAICAFSTQRVDCEPWQVVMVGSTVAVLDIESARELRRALIDAGRKLNPTDPIDLDGVAVTAQDETEESHERVKRYLRHSSESVDGRSTTGS